MLEEQISEDYKQAMRDKNPARVSTLSFLRAQLKNVHIDKRVDKLDDAEVIVVIKKQVKQRQDSIDQFEKGGRADLATKEKAELEILKSYLPAEISAGELKAIVQGVIKEVAAESAKDMGKVMKALLPKVEGRADNKAVSQMVRELLSA